VGGVSIGISFVGVTFGSGEVVDSGRIGSGETVAPVQATKTIPITRTKYLVIIVQSP
jgi:hypothetical protein